MGSGAFADFSGTYELTGGERYEAYLESIGVAAADREAMASAQQTVTVKQEGDHYTLTTTTPARTTVLRFTLGQEYVATYDDGRQVKGIARRDGNFVQQRLKVGGSYETTVVSVIGDAGFEVMFKGVGVDAKRSYRRLA
ncbi:lipocalin/fatty-acid binding family protein [Kitasatospora sp. NPDC059827]|uniref:lipocalin/fatty-acid binding family protein n=1 Tax=Kitasatospora sp. NPDC059827 TaxID=3346964 RepID=UPI0036502415